MNEKRLEEIAARSVGLMGRPVPYGLGPEVVEFLIHAPLDLYDLVDEVRRLREREWKLGDAPPPSRSNIISKG